MMFSSMLGDARLGVNVKTIPTMLERFQAGKELANVPC
jgi:hypothetical protein